MSELAKLFPNLKDKLTSKEGQEEVTRPRISGCASLDVSRAPLASDHERDVEA